MRSIQPQSHRRRRAALAFTLLVACVEDEDSAIDEAEEDSDFEDEQSGDDDEDFRAHWGVLADHFGIARDGSVASFATGSIQIPLRDGSGNVQYGDGGWLIRGTCGITFVSPRYAITAAHCVTTANVLAGDWLVVKNYDVTGTLDWFFYFSAWIDGSWPNYEADVPAHELPGYQVTPYLCQVTARCGDAGTTCAGGDAALLYCPYRPSTAAWLPVAPSDPGTGPVEMYWYHELLDFPLTDPGNADPEGHDRYEHYVELDQNDRGNNFHYLETLATQMVPLVSLPWPDGTQRQRLGGGGTWTDMYGCHGTSGSGVLQRNASGNLELLGPVQEGAGAWVFDRLCDDPERLTPGVAGISYAPNEHVRALESAYSWQIYWDRYPIVWHWPPNPPVFDPG